MWQPWWRLMVLAGLVLAITAIPGDLALAQTSTSYSLEENVFNAGGHPISGTVLTSSSFRLTLGAIGDGVIAADSVSSSFSMGGGFVRAYPPPGEVTNVRFLDPTTLVWDGERSVGVYNLYQGAVLVPFDPAYGGCQTPGITTEAVIVSATPQPGQALFILLTAKNRLGEEGAKGSSSEGGTRDNSNPCP
jgi:hypothetical protein